MPSFFQLEFPLDVKKKSLWPSDIDVKAMTWTLFTPQSAIHHIHNTHTNTHTHTIFLQSSLQIENPAKWAKKTSQRGGKEAEVGGKRDTLPFVNTHGIWNSEKLICVRLKNLKRVEAQHPPFCQQWKPVTPCRFPESWKETVDDRPNSSFRRRPHK